MNHDARKVSPGKWVARVVSIVSLALVWAVVWANLPSKDQLFFVQEESPIAVSPVEPGLDLTIPGLHPSPTASSDSVGGIPTENDGARVRTGPSDFASPAAVHARQVAEIKCVAEAQRLCPESLSGAERQRCVERRLKGLPPVCQQIVRQRIVHWKHAEDYKFACQDDLKRFCATVQPGDGRRLQCLQDHAQDVSEDCYQSLPKGHLLLRQ